MFKVYLCFVIIILGYYSTVGFSYIFRVSNYCSLVKLPEALAFHLIFSKKKLKMSLYYVFPFNKAIRICRLKWVSGCIKITNLIRWWNGALKI